MAAVVIPFSAFPSAHAAVKSGWLSLWMYEMPQEFAIPNKIVCCQALMP